MTDLANGFSTKILQKCNFYMETKKNNFVNLGDTDKKCQHPAGEGTQGAIKIDQIVEDTEMVFASKIDRTFHFSNTPTCVLCERAIYDMEYGSMFCRAHRECTREYYTCDLWQRNR